MCFVDKCCYCVPLKTACLILGVINFVTSIMFIIISAAVYFHEDKSVSLKEQPHLVATLLGLDLKMETVNIILSIVVTVSFFWVLFSALLIAGTLKHEPSLLLSYFSFGIILTILGQLAALLMLLNKCWLLTVVIFIPSTLNIHFLVVIYTSYELMQKDDFSFSRRHDEEEDPLSDCFDETIVD